MVIAATDAIAATTAVPPSITPTPAHMTPQASVTAARGVWWPDEAIRAASVRASETPTRSASTSRTRWSTRVRSS